MLLYHGQNELHISEALARDSFKKLKSHGLTNLTFVTEKGLDHRLSAKGLTAMREFFATHMPAELKPEVPLQRLEQHQTIL